MLKLTVCVVQAKARQKHTLNGYGHNIHWRQRGHFGTKLSTEPPRTHSNRTHPSRALYQRGRPFDTWLESNSRKCRKTNQMSDYERKFQQRSSQRLQHPRECPKKYFAKYVHVGKEIEPSGYEIESLWMKGTNNTPYSLTTGAQLRFLKLDWEAAIWRR